VIERTSECDDLPDDYWRLLTPLEIDDLLFYFYEATSGLVDFFDDAQLRKDIDALMHATYQFDRDGPAGALIYLVIAIGVRQMGESDADIWFERGKAVLLSCVNHDMTIDSVRGFALVSIWMLGAFQPNAAYLNFGTRRLRVSFGIF
jgi:hypothetical protein